MGKAKGSSSKGQSAPAVKKDKTTPATPVDQTASQEQPGANGDQEKLQDHIVTAEDLLNNPELAENGVKEGDTIQIPVAEDPQVEQVDHVVTQEDLNLNPALVEQGVQIGDVIQVDVKGPAIIPGFEEEMPGTPGLGEQAPGSGLPPVVQHPNPARVESDNAEQAAASATPGQLAKSQISAAVKGIIDRAVSKVKPSQDAQKIMEQLGVPELYENTQGEYFSEFDLAVFSEKGNKDKVKTHIKNA